MLIYRILVRILPQTLADIAIDFPGERRLVTCVAVDVTVFDLAATVATAVGSSLKRIREENLWGIITATPSFYIKNIRVCTGSAFFRARASCAFRRAS